jgi:hypothetical protein
MALQEHLRQFYTYSLTPPAVPASAEPVDHFLFETRVGYCQHFAEAFTVLARLAGLPARLATGYSPGNYNVLSNCFEVYEYHAHAWTQIYIEPYGWLTFDGVAPGNLRIESGPPLLRQLMDPFPETWSAHPPELSLRAPTPSQRWSRRSGAGSRPNSLTKALAGVYAQAMRESHSRHPSAAALLRALGAALREWSTEQWERAWKALTGWGAEVGMQLYGGLQRAWRYLRSLSASTYLTAAGTLLLLGALYGRRRLLLAVLTTAWQRWACARGWRRLERARDALPAERVRAGYELLRQIMFLGRFTRPGNLDAEEYADWLEGTEPHIGPDYRTVAHVIHRLTYRDLTPSAADAEAVLDAIGRIRAEIGGRLTLAGARRRATAEGPRP